MCRLEVGEYTPLPSHAAAQHCLNCTTTHLLFTTSKGALKQVHTTPSAVPITSWRPAFTTLLSIWGSRSCKGSRAAAAAAVTVAKQQQQRQRWGETMSGGVTLCVSTTSGAAHNSNCTIAGLHSSHDHTYTRKTVNHPDVVTLAYPQPQRTSISCMLP
jgi:hypothetical protein